MLEDVMPCCSRFAMQVLLEMDSGLIRLTARGRMVSNEVFSRLLHCFDGIIQSIFKL